MKKVLSLVLVLAMVLGSFSFVSAAPKDVAGTVYEDAVTRLELLGILQGYPDGTFKPENQITRAEFAAVAIRAKGLDSTAQAAKGLATGFSDVPAGHWASGYVGTAAKMGIVNGVGNGQFAPEAPVKYEEAITMLVRALGYEAAAKARGGYPYGYLIVANENGLLDAVKGTQGAPALRGTVAQLADNALEIPMMVQVGFGSETKWVISGTKEHGGDERYLLDDMGFDSVKGRVVSVSPKTDKLTVDPTDEDLKNVTLKVSEDFDFYSVEGLETKFWYKNDTVVVYVVNEEAKFDAVKYDSKEKELTLIAEDENYEVAKDAYLELDGEKVKIDKFVADYAKIVLNDDNEIIWAQGYTLDGFVLVEEVKDNVAYSYNEYDEVKIKDFTVVKEGKTIGIDGIEEEDILFFNVDEKFAVVSNNGKEGKLDRVYTDGTFRFEGAGYGKSDIGAPIYFDEGKVGELDADILKDFLDDEAKITVYVDFAGKAIVVAGEVSSVGNSAYVALTADAVEYKGRKGDMIALDVRNGANEKVSYDLVVKDLGKDIKLTGIKPEELAKLKKADDVVLKISVDKDGDVTGIELPESVKLGKTFKIDDANAKDKAGYSYKLQASTVVFYDGNKKATSLGNAKDAFKEVKEGATLYIEKGRVVAVIGETDTDADTKDVTGLVTGVKEVAGGRLQFTVKVFGTTERLLTESKTLKESAYTKYVDHIVTFKVGETSNDIKDEKDSISFAKGETITITKLNGRTISSKEYDDVELNTKAKIYDADLDEINLRDLKKDMVVTVYFQGSSKRFVDYVIVGTVDKDIEEKEGVVTYVNIAPGYEAFAVDGKLVTLTKDMVLVEDGKIILSGAQIVTGTKKLVEGDQVKIDGNTITIVKRADEVATETAKAFKEAHKEVLALTETTVKVENETAVKRAQAAFDKLSDAAQAKLATEKQLLLDLQAKIDTLKAADEDQAMVDAELAKVPNTLELEAVSLSTIKEAVEAKVNLNKVRVAVTLVDGDEYKVELTSKVEGSKADKKITVTKAISEDEAMVNAELKKVKNIVLPKESEVTQATVKEAVEDLVDLNKVKVEVEDKTATEADTWGVKLTSKVKGATAETTIKVTVAE